LLSEVIVMARTRSPNYPYIGLGAALERVKKIYDKEHQNRMSRAVVAKHLGFGSLNGVSLSVISALGKYGLLVSIDEDLQVSNDALTILVDPPDSAERAQALRRAALKPDLFSELHKHFGGQLPSDVNLLAYLQKHGFTANAAALAAKSFRETMQLISGQDSGARASGGEPAGSSEMEQQLPSLPAKGSAGGMQTVFLMRLKDGTVVELRANTELGAEHAKPIKGLVDMALGAEQQR
jgi:hypothetical protein